jgi:alpha-beta hydrolase superfamily lysophospholipase
MKRISLFTFCGLLILILAVRLIGTDTSANIRHLMPSPSFNPKAKHLVVVLHAFNNSRENLEDVINEIRHVYPHSDISSPSYNAGVFANASLSDIAAQLNDGIQEIVDAKHQSGQTYDEIILVGHSIGALLARKIYLYGYGNSPDHPLGQRANTPKAWVDQVTRIILLAGMNRGWSADTQDGIAWLRTTVGEYVHSVFDIGHLIMSARRGSPFVVNLKLEWIRLVNSGKPIAQVIQLLGDNDKIAPLSDHNELMASPQFVFIPVSGTRHADIIDMPGAEDQLDANDADTIIQKRRQRAFRAALSHPVSDLINQYGSNAHMLDSLDADRKQIEHVVFVMHGIRDYGEWVSTIGQALETRDASVRAITSKYGYFPMGRFLMFSDREKNVRWFVDQYTEALALYPNSKKFSFIGHSNGTYLLASALENYHAIKMHRVYFAGSVVRTDFPWDAFIPKRVLSVRNDVAADDWVVAWFPKLFQIIRKQLGFDATGFFNLGSAGFNGFESGGVNKHQGYVFGGHGAALQYQDSIIDYVIGDNLSDVPQETDTPNAAIAFMSNVAWLVWILIAITLVLGAWLTARIKFIQNRLNRTQTYLLYSLFIGALIYTV